jgi:hypothetical protein
MAEDMVMRSVYLRPSEDAELRQLAHDLEVTKSDLIRSAISLKLQEWLKSNDRERILKEVEHGRRDEAAIRSGRRGRPRPSEAAAVTVPTAQAVVPANAPSKAQPAPADEPPASVTASDEALV